METTRLSSKGQVVLPKWVRDARRWPPGTEFEVREVPEGVMLRAKRPFKPTTIDEVISRFKYRGPRKTLRQMERGIAREVRARHARGRY